MFSQIIRLSLLISLFRLSPFVSASIYPSFDDDRLAGRLDRTRLRDDAVGIGDSLLFFLDLVFVWRDKAAVSLYMRGQAVSCVGIPDHIHASLRLSCPFGYYSLLLKQRIKFLSRFGSCVGCTILFTSPFVMTKSRQRILRVR